MHVVRAVETVVLLGIMAAVIVSMLKDSIAIIKGKPRRTFDGIVVRRLEDE